MAGSDTISEERLAVGVGSRVRALAAAAPALGVALVALLVVPGVDDPFGWPRAWALAAVAVTSIAWSLRGRSSGSAWAPGALLAAAALACAFGPLAGPLPALQALSVAALVLGFSLARPRPEAQGPVLLGAGGVVALVTVLQALGVDLLGLAGPGRLAVYGTLGNPDFVAAFLAPLLVLGIARRWTRARRWEFATLALIALGLVVTRSLGSLLALAAGGAVLALAAWRAHRAGLGDDARAGGSPRLALAPEGGTSRRQAPARAASPAGSAGALLRGPARWAGLALALAFTLVAAFAARRDVSTALAGRLYLWRVAAPHLLDRPLTGLGPGAVDASWPVWEAEAWKAGAFTAAQARFVGAQDHLHQDLLERLVEQGVPGLAALLLVVAVAVFRLLRSRTPEATAFAAALVALLARGLVDFPLSRPAEGALFALLVAVGLSQPASSSPPQSPTQERS